MPEPDSNLTGVMHLIDSLAAGGAERMAVNLANLMPRDRYRSYLCTTRCEGPLAEQLACDVGRLRLNRRRRLAPGPVLQLAAFSRKHKVRILHAHGTTLMMAGLASLLPPFPAVVWHVHFGGYVQDERAAWTYRLLTQRAHAIIAVNQALAAWSQHRLRMPAGRIWYVPNFACQDGRQDAAPDLPGTRGARIACVANLRPEKDHLTLLQAMHHVVRQSPQAHLLLLGAVGDPEYARRVQQEIVCRGLSAHVSLLGPRRDVAAVLRGCTIGVLSSLTEGLPLSLLEYGMAGLPAVATDVGQCAEVLDGGQAGLIVPAAAPELLAQALLTLLRSPQQRAELGQRFGHRAREAYSAEAALRQISHVYDCLLPAPLRQPA